MRVYIKKRNDLMKFFGSLGSQIAIIHKWQKKMF